MGRYSWRKGKQYDGQFRGAETYELRRNGERIATAQKDTKGWFWYGDGVNTAHRPTTLQAVKDEALGHFKSPPTGE